MAGAQPSHAGAITLIMDTIVRSDCAAAPGPTPTAPPTATATPVPGTTPTVAPAATATPVPGATPTVAPGPTATPVPDVATFGPAGTTSPTGPATTMTTTSSVLADTQRAGQAAPFYLAVVLGLVALVLVLARAPARHRMTPG